jgi:hypothetical protein
MDRFFDALFHDPILFTTALVLLATIGILIWALSVWRKTGFDASDPQDEADDGAAPLHEEQPETAGLAEARLQEILNELGSIGTRMQALEKKVSEPKPFDQTIPVPAAAAGPSSVEIERLIKRLESKIEALSVEKSQLPSDSLTRIETRLEGIHRLLILLTESGGSSPEK